LRSISTSRQVLALAQLVDLVLILVMAFISGLELWQGTRALDLRIAEGRQLDASVVLDSVDRTNNSLRLS